MRVRIGLQATDATRDADISVASEMALQTVELYLDRKLIFGQYTEWADCSYPSYLVKAWPIDRAFGIIQSDGAIPELNWVISGTPDALPDSYVKPPSGPSASGTFTTSSSVLPWSPWSSTINAAASSGVNRNEVHVDWEKGIIHHTSNHPYQIAYYGGFKILPPVLVWALLAVFDAVWSSDSSFGGTAGGGLIQGSGAVKKVSLVGIGSVDLDVGTTVSDGSGGNSGAAWGLIPSAARTILDRYRRESAVGVG
jgi:hypothetical protein